MKSLTNLFLLLVTILFVSCSSKQFAFRKTYDVKKETNQQLTQVTKSTLHTYDSIIPAKEETAGAIAIIKDTPTKETIEAKVVALKKKHQVRSASKIIAFKPLKKQVFHKPAETASAQQPAFIISLIVLILFAILFLALAVVIIPAGIFLFVLLLIIVLIVFLLSFLLGIFS